MHALVLVDIQKDYFPGGRMEVIGALEACENARKLLTAFREKNLPILHIQHIAARPGATFLLPNTDGIDFHENVKPLTAETVIKKHFPNSFRETDLEKHLRSKGIKDLVICGMMSHMCIDTTTRAAFDLGYSCLAAYDACATRNMTFNGLEVPAKQVHAAYMSALGAVFAKVLSTESIIGQM